MNYPLQLIFLLILFPMHLMAKNCPESKHWVKAHKRSGRSVTGYCRSNPKGYKSWDSSLSNSRPTNWFYSKEKSKRWKISEVESIILILRTFPPFFERFRNIKVFRMIKSIEYPNSGAYFSKNIILYDTAFLTKEKLKSTLYHELSHALYDSLTPTLKRSYEKELSWGRLGKLWIGRNSGYVEADGSLSPDEDFSNNLEYYLSKPKQLKKVSPKAFDWLKRNLK